MPSSTSSKPNPSLRLLLNQDKARTSFACVAFATLHIATASVDPETGAVRAGRDGGGGAGSRMDRVKGMLEEGVGYELRAMGVSPPPPTTTTGSNAAAAMAATTTGNRPNATRSRRSVEGRAVALANRIIGLGLGMMKLRAFMERQEDVFAILGAAG
ncbi:hypothetical protein CPC08DRAFT_730594 [Agrocybe pediades]|nr:hypothetical protein CPC08DRAFT_730594 [Agrocybe pediades]